MFALGHQLVVTKKVARIVIRLEPETHSKLKAVAKSEDCSTAWLARKFIKAGISAAAEQKPKKP